MADLVIQKVSRLAKLGLTPEEEGTFQKDLDRLIDFVSALSAVPTEQVQPLINPMTEEIPLRLDLVVQDGSVEEILKNAPSKEQNLFLVPKIVE
ncbi:MAG: Asp-tRNA(Asn)/Glu-tRNA(Gln) amidotransferase subunit GatC [Holosporales bacterium]